MKKISKLNNYPQIKIKKERNKAINLFKITNIGVNKIYFSNDEDNVVSIKDKPSLIIFLLFIKRVQGYYEWFQLKALN